MTPQEKDLIQTVFDRLQRAGGGAKDSEAEAFIREQVRRQPDAAYGLTQAVIVLEAGLNQAQQKLNDLQRQLDEARGGAAQSGGSFLGGSPWGSGSVPRSGPVTQAQPQPAYAPPSYYSPQPSGPWAQQPSGGSSFLRNAATMAAGVAGGTLIAEGLTSLFSGHRYGGFGGGFGGGYGGGFGGPEIIEENVTNNYYNDDRQGGGADFARDDSGYQDASYDDSGSFDDGGDFGTDV